MTTKFVATNETGKTLRQCLQERGFSATQVRRYKFGGKITVNGREVQVNYVLQDGDVVCLTCPDLLQTPQFAPQPANVLFEDEYLYVAEKPYGMPIHPDRAHKNGTLGNALATHFGNGFQLHIVTRLDKTTSGLVLGALNAETANLLNAMQQRHEICKEYQARVEGVLPNAQGKIALPLMRIDEQNKTVVDDGGKYACTKFWVEKQTENSAFVWAIPVTGRTHQIRAHFAATRHPVCGDVLYGAQPDGRIELHCAKISFVHPVTHEKVQIALPAEFWQN